MAEHSKEGHTILVGSFSPFTYRLVERVKAILAIHLVDAVLVHNEDRILGNKICNWLRLELQGFKQEIRHVANQELASLIKNTGKALVLDQTTFTRLRDFPSLELITCFDALLSNDWTARDHWQEIPSYARPHYVQKIVLVGPESTGKSTLSKALSERLSCPMVSEQSRPYFSERNNKSTLEDIGIVAAMQLFGEEQQARHSKNGLLVCDTDTISMEVWSQLYFGSVPDWLLEINSIPNEQLYFLMDIDIPWQPDPLREFPHRRQEHFNLLEERLIRYGKKYKKISGLEGERLRETLKQLNLR